VANARAEITGASLTSAGGGGAIDGRGGVPPFHPSLGLSEGAVHAVGEGGWGALGFETFGVLSSFGGAATGSRLLILDVMKTAEAKHSSGPNAPPRHGEVMCT
jgi:hypothetical protein